MALKLSTGLRDALLNNTGLKDALDGGVIHVFAGTQPAGTDGADLDESGYTKLLEITLDGNTFTPGDPSTNGLSFDAPASGVLSKASGEVWSGEGLAQDVAGWFRFYDKSETTGASTTAIRFDGSIATSGGQLTVSTSTVQIGTPFAVDSLDLTLPAS